MSTKFFTNDPENTLLEKFEGGLIQSYPKYYCAKNATNLVVNGNRYFKKIVELIPIPSSNYQDKAFINETESLVRRIYEEPTDLSELSVRIDEMVYRLFDLSEEEIAFIESKSDLIRE